MFIQKRKLSEQLVLEVYFNNLYKYQNYFMSDQIHFILIIKKNTFVPNCFYLIRMIQSCKIQIRHYKLKNNNLNRLFSKRSYSDSF